MEYILIPEKGSLSDYMNLLMSQEVLAIDTETTGLDVFKSRIRLIQIASYNNPVVVLDMFYLSDSDCKLLKDIFACKNIKIFQNAKFDLKFLAYNGFSVEGTIFDTMIAGQLLKSNSGPFKVNLADLAKYYLGIDLPKEEQKSDFSGNLTDSQHEYAAKDAYILLDLRQIMSAELKKAQLTEIAVIEFNCIPAIVDIELTGIKADQGRLSEYAAIVKEELLSHQEKLNSFVKNRIEQQTFFGPPESQTINFNSMKQVLDFLNENGIMVTDTSQASLSRYADHPIVLALKEYRKSYKLYSGFLESLPEHINMQTGRIHASYSQIGAYSGRMSCRNPNMQQIPRDNSIRDLFIPEKGYRYIIADYSQVELRVAADIAKDERMIQAYKNNQDLHKLTASLITETAIDEVTKTQRQAAKAVNFGLIFGMGSKGLQDYAHDTYNIDISVEQADLFRNQYFKAYTGIRKWHDSLKANPPESARSLTGRRYFYNSQTGFSSYCNTPVQGTAADILKNALGHLYQVIKGTDIHIVAVIHDEIILECKEEKCEKMSLLLKNIMENSSKDFLLSVPMVADVVIAKSWAEK